MQNHIRNVARGQEGVNVGVDDVRADADAEAEGRTGSDLGAGSAPIVLREPSAVTRSGWLKRVAIGLGSLSAGGAAAAGMSTATAQSPSSRDREVLAFALTLEHLQATFYSKALRSGKLSGELHQFAQVVGSEEREHLVYLTRAVGRAAAPAQRFRFGDAVTDPAKFLATAVILEEAGLAAYNGQAANLSPKALMGVGRVISVEARHAAWARAIAGKQPAPNATDKPISAAQAHQALQPFLA